MIKAIALIRTPDVDLIAPLRAAIVSGCGLALIFAGSAGPF